MSRDEKTLLRKFHQARWDEQIIFEMSVPGERGILVPEAEEEIQLEIGDISNLVPGQLLRRARPGLPEINQMRVNRHYLRLSQETLGADVNLDISQGTCTMKYSPRVQEHTAARNPGITELHPLQEPETVQGILEMYFKLEGFLKEISGMDRFSLQPGGGAHAVFTGASIIRAHHKERGEEQRDEIITTIFSHPCNAAGPATAGFKVITLMPDENGYPDLQALKQAVSDRTAGLFITNPEDTGIYNPQIEEFVRIIHDVGGLAYYDQANANGLLGITRARDAGFDMCHFNVHKTFSAPHGSYGPGLGAIGVCAELEKYLPLPLVDYDGERYSLDMDRPQSVGKIRSFLGNAPITLKAYSWIMQHGDQGLKEAAKVSVMNSNYLEKKVREIPGVVVWYAEGKRRLEQVRYSWEKLYNDTGVGTDDVMRRASDYGVEHFWKSHHPWVVPEPFTLEPCESYSKDDLDEYIAILEQVSREAYADPDFVRNAPYNLPVHKVADPTIDDPERIAVTWRQYCKKREKAMGAK